MSGRRYLVYDVFTDAALAGNPLAVVLDAGGLETAAMQRIAREFNLSETAFVSPPANRAHTAAVRIFTPGLELPFAGHPTVGTAIALAAEHGIEFGDAAALLVLEEEVGNVRCAVSGGRGMPFAEFDLPHLPQPLPFAASREAVAAALRLGHHEIGFENHEISAWTAGVAYVCVPVSGLDAAARVSLDAGQWLEIAGGKDGLVGDPYVYCRETVGHDCDFHARMFAPFAGIAEDPATGSAAAAFAGAVMRFDQPRDGVAQCMIEQGTEMGRPSRIRLEMDVEGGRLAAARIGGHAVKVAEGTLHV